MEACRESLRVELKAIDAGLVLVGELKGKTVCVSAIDKLECDSWELDAFFVHPDFIGHGIGRKLFKTTIELLKNRGCKELRILSDPQAQPFYEAMGAVFVRQAPSNVIPGRSLPLLNYTVGDI